MLNESAAAVRDAVRGRVEAGRPMDTHYDHPILMLQHLIWHEGYHHGQIKLALKQVGQPDQRRRRRTGHLGPVDGQGPVAQFRARKDVMTSQHARRRRHRRCCLRGERRGRARPGAGRRRRPHRVPAAARHAGPVRGAVSHQHGDAGGRHRLRPGGARAPAGAARRPALSRPGRARQPSPLRPGPGLRAAAAPHARRAEPAGVDVRPLACRCSTGCRCRAGRRGSGTGPRAS